MTKKEFLKSFWEELMSHADLNSVPNEPGKEWIIGFELHIGYGQTAKMLQNQIKKYQIKRAIEWLEGMKYDDKTDGN